MYENPTFFNFDVSIRAPKMDMTGFRLLIPICIMLRSPSTYMVNGVRIGLTNAEFEGCIRERKEESEESPRNQRHKNRINPHAEPKRNTMENITAAGRPPQQVKPKYNKANEPKWEVHEKNLNYKPKLIDTGFHSSQIVSSKEFEEEVERMDPKTLAEWKEYAESVKEIINVAEEGPKLCSTPPLGPPLLDTYKRINHAWETVSNKLKYGTVHKKDTESGDAEEGEQE